MRLGLPELLGLTIGFTLGGLGLTAMALLDHDSPATPIAAEAIAARPIPAMPAGPQPLSRHPAPNPPSVAPPRVHHPAGPTPSPLPRQVANLPAIVRPTDPSRGGAEPGQPKGGNLSGTGFFIAGDGTILTAAHVVNGCRMTEVAASGITRTQARILATSPRDDLALLRVRVRPPALLALSDALTGQRDLVVYGYPAQGDPLVPSETAARARPDIGRAAGWAQDPGLWIEAGGIRQGFSGGPVVTAEGAAIGLIKGVVLRRGTTVDAEPAPSGIAIGPDTRAIRAFLRQEAPDLDAGSPWSSQAGDTAAARRAVVHVFCWR